MVSYISFLLFIFILLLFFSHLYVFLFAPLYFMYHFAKIRTQRHWRLYGNDDDDDDDNDAVIPRSICLISRAPRDAVNLLTTSRAVCSYELTRFTSIPDYNDSNTIYTVHISLLYLAIINYCSTSFRRYRSCSAMPPILHISP